MPWRCSGILMFLESENPVVCVLAPTHLSYASILHKTLLLLNSYPIIWDCKSERKDGCFYSFPLLRRSKVLWCLRFTLLWSVTVIFSHLSFLLSYSLTVRGCPSLLDLLLPPFLSISTVTLRIPDEFSSFNY